MRLVIPSRLMAEINTHVEKAYPEEGAGFLIGEEGQVREIIALSNAREDGARLNRFLFTPEDYLKAELKSRQPRAEPDRSFSFPPRLPQHPLRIRPRVGPAFFLLHHHSCRRGKAVNSRSWKLLEDRSKYEEEEIEIS